MIKKYLLVGALVAPLTLTEKANSFEFPEEPPYGSISANVSYYSQYIWRGEQQNAGQSAIQGGFDYGITLVDVYRFLRRYLGIQRFWRNQFIVW